jgi:hypothetical protein
MTQVSDLRGTAATTREAAILEDPTGRRGRRLRLLARAIAVLLTVWLVALLLGAVGINPVSGIPFGQALKPPAPSPATSLPEPRKASRADLKPALPAKAVGSPAPTTVTSPGRTRRLTTRSPSSGNTPTRRRANAKKPTKTLVVGPTPAAPRSKSQGQGQVNGGGNQSTSTTTSPGNSGTTGKTTAPGQTHTTTGKTTAPGQTHTTPTPQSRRNSTDPTAIP